MGTHRSGKNKNYIRSISIVAVILLLGGLVALGVMISREPKQDLPDVTKVQKPKVAHISIDDSTVLFHDIYAHQYESIFDNPVFAKLQYLHEEYGVIFTLYVFEDYYGFKMLDMPVYYKQEFKENADWLKIGFHSASVANPAESRESLDEFTDAYEWTISAIWKFAGGDSIANVLRLHYWYATDERVEYLAKQGVKGLLCSDSRGESYNLSQEQRDLLYGSLNGELAGEINYYETDFRVENMVDVRAELEKRKNDRVLVLFTHAEVFEENYQKLEDSIEWLDENRYQFTTLEDLQQ